MHECKDEIMFIQGDVVETYFYIEGIEREYIENLYFSCEAEKILTVLPYSEEQEGYCFRLTSEQTSTLRPKFCTYDLTLELIDGNRMTLLHGRSFIVLKKRNTLNPEDYLDDEEEPDSGEGEDGEGENSGNEEGGNSEDNGGESGEGNGENGNGEEAGGNENEGGESGGGDDLGDNSGENGGDENTDLNANENGEAGNNSNEGEDNTNEND